MKAIVKNSKIVNVEKVDAPALVSPSDVLIRVAVAGLCRTDVYVAEDRIKTRTPLIIGHEFSGIVEAVGEKVSHVKTGQRVAVMPLFPTNDNRLRNGVPSYANSTMMGVDHDGAFSEFVVVPGYSVHALPDHVTFKEGAYMEPIAASLAVLNADIHQEQKGLIYGDNRISRLTERIMKTRGFKDLEIFDHESGPGALQENSYDFIIETLITTETMQEIVRAVKPGGTIVLKSRQHTPVAINVNTLVIKDITMQAVGYGDFAEGIELVASGALKTADLFGDVFPLEQYERVFKESERGESLKLFFSAMERNVWDR